MLWVVSRERADSRHRVPGVFVPLLVERLNRLRGNFTVVKKHSSRPKGTGENRGQNNYDQEEDHSLSQQYDEGQN